MIEGYFGGKGGQTPICGYCSQKVSVPVFHGYFERNDGRLRMPSQGKDERDEVGIRWSGRVLPGEDAVEQRRADVDFAARLQERQVRPGVTGERYQRVEDYDPVLRDACRLE